MARVIFDTNIFTAYKDRLVKRDFGEMALSIVVWYELTATTIDQTAWQLYESWRVAAHQEDRLLTPTMNDWRESAKLVARVRFDDKRKAHGLTPKDAHATQLQNDALIARAAYLKGFSVVTENVDDFQKLQRFLKFDLVPAKDYFGL